MREVRIEPNGDVIEVKRFEPGAEPPASYLKPPEDENYPRGVSYESLNDGWDGFLINYLEPGDTYRKQFERIDKTGEGYPTMWIRPGQPPLPLSVRYDEIFSPVYLKYLDKFLLNNGDTSMSSSTNSNIAVRPWNRHYEYTPFRLLARDGTVEDIPYPDFIFDCGIASRKWQNGVGRNFSIFLPTRAGILISKDRENGSSLYLFQNNQLYQIAGGKMLLGVNLAHLSAERISLNQLSPGGCKFAYSHLGTDRSYRAPKFLTILDLCKAAQ